MVNENEVITIKLDDIIPNRFQPREVFDEDALNELAESIKLHGVIQPIIVRQVDNKYEIIAGERRYKASVLAGKTEIPALVKNKDDKESSIIAYIENSQRKNVSAIEEARTCERLLSTNDLTQEQLAKQLGMSQSTLANKLRLLTLPVEIQEAVLHGDVSERHARCLLSIKDTKKQLELLEKVKENKMTVRELEGEIKAMENNGLNAQGLYDLPGSEDYNNTAVNNDTDLSTYEINPASEVKQEDISTPPPLETPAPAVDIPMPTVGAPEPAQEEKQEEIPVQSSGEFLSFLNDFDDSAIAAPLTEEKKEATEEVKEDAVETPTEVPVEAPKEEPSLTVDIPMPTVGLTEPAAPAAEPVSEPAPEAPVPAAPAGNSFTSFLNEFNSDNLKETVQEQGKSEFDEFLKKYENNATPAEGTNEEPSDEDPAAPADGGVTATPVVETPAEPTNNASLDDFLKKYEAPAIPAVPEQKIETPEEAAPAAPADDFSKYLNTADTSEIANKYLNPINDVVPKVEYVENQPNYVDTTKPKSYDTVDEIITALKETTDKVKQSKYKVTTEEVNFDDIYKITITIDKRNFL